MDKYAQLREKQTNGANYELDTDDVINKLQGWDSAHGIELSDVDYDKVTVRFERLPDDVMALAREIYEFCPDTIDQGFGCFAEMLEMAEEMEEEVAPQLLELVEGVDLTDDDYGLELLKRSLEREPVVGLWWD